MLGLWLEDQALSLRTDLPVPRPPAGEALVRVIQAGICNTDLELVRGYYPYRGVLGHEFVGRVESEGEWHGRRVCGECGRNYHVTLSPPRQADRCDGCGGVLYQRRDDEEATVLRRLAVYARDTRPLVAHYRAQGLLEAVPAGGSVAEVFEAVLRAAEGPR